MLKALGILLGAAVVSITIVTFTFAQDQPPFLQMALNQLTSEQLSYIQKGWNGNVAQCAIDKIHTIVQDNLAGDQWIITLDAKNPQITLQRKDNASVVVCQLDGIHEIGNGSGDALKFDTLTPYAAQ